MLDILTLALYGILPGAIAGFVLGMIAYRIVLKVAYGRPADQIPDEDDIGFLALPVGFVSAVAAGIVYYYAYAARSMRQPVTDAPDVGLGVAVLVFMGILVAASAGITAGITYSRAMRR